MRFLPRKPLRSRRRPRRRPSSLFFVLNDAFARRGLRGPFFFIERLGVLIQVMERTAFSCGPESPRDSLVLRVAYDGSGYSGFAIQEKQTHVKTVAGELRRALEVLLKHPVSLTCSGRTDAGVHALRQFVSIPLAEGELDTVQNMRVLRAMSALLPEDIRVSGVYRASPCFSARFSAEARVYRYRLFLNGVPALFNGKWSWWVKVQDLRLFSVDSMFDASRCLIGEHDFASFCKSESAVGKPTCRFVESIDFQEERCLGESLLSVQITGNAFLHSMVRTIIGTLVEVGYGRRDPSWVSDVLLACDRRCAGPTAPACGLTLWDVRYPEGSLIPVEVSSAC